MYRHVLAFDFDGTLAQNCRVPIALQQVLEQLRQDNFALFLATGRQYESIELGLLRDIFTGIVWENGAVLSLKAIDDLYLPFGHVDTRLVTALETAGVPLEHGTAIVSTWMPHEEAVWQARITDVASFKTKQHGDFGAWVKGPWMMTLWLITSKYFARCKDLKDEALREALVQHVTARYAEIRTLR